MKQYKQLTLKERYQIEALLGMGLTARDIAAKLMRSNKTISSEMLRCTIGCYRAEIAQSNAVTKRVSAAKFTKINQQVVDIVDSALTINYSPEQIAGRAKLEALGTQVSMHTISS